VAGLKLKAYWFSNYFFDTIRGLVLSGVTFGILKLYSLEIEEEFWTVLLVYPASITIFTFATSFMFKNSASAQNVTLFTHMALSLLVSVGIFMLRVTKEAEDTGDLLYDVSRWTGIPSVNLANSFLYSFENDLMNRTRNYTEAEVA
jgi:hypothetical protein